MADLLINGKDALQEWGVRMGTGFMDAIDVPCQMKEYIENDSRLEHGKRVITSNPKLDARTLTLPFTIQGETESDYQAKKKSFYNELYKGKMDIQIPVVSGDVYHLVYTGGSTSYAQNRQRTFCKFSVKFQEPNPSNRV